MSTTKDVEDGKPPTPPPPPPIEYERRSERRAARVAQEKIAESAKYLASNKIMATTSPPPPTKPRKKKAFMPASTKTTTIGQTGQKMNPAASGGTSSLLLTSQKTTGGGLQIKSIPSTGFKSSIVKTASGQTAIRPQLPAGHTLPKMPILVFNSFGTSMPSLIPIVPSSNTIVTLTPGGGIQRTCLSSPSSNAIKSLQQAHLKSAEIVSRPTSTANCSISTKFQKYSSVSKLSIGMTMECEEETLSSAQWTKYRKAESEYMEVLRKLTRWKGRSDVEIVHLGPDDPIPPVPRFLNVQEASRQIVPQKAISYSSVVDADVIIEMETNSCDSETLTPLVQIEDESEEKPSAKPRLNVVTVPPIHNQTPPAPSQQKAQTTTKESASTSASSSPVRRSVFVTNAANRLTMSGNKNPIGNDGGTSSQKPSPPKYPELSVKLCPQKLLPLAVSDSKKLKLDAFMRKLILSGKSNVDRWMLEKGLFGVNRICMFHTTEQMKLMFMSTQTSNDAPLAPIQVGPDGRGTGGVEGVYKWWCPGCASMLPVDQGSFFSKWTRSHSSILQVIYHWACNTDIKLVIQQMRGDTQFVSGVYAAIRAVCATQTYKWRVGGAGHPVEVANKEIGHCKNVRNVNLYCAYDRLSRNVKLGAASASDLRPRMASLFKLLVDKDSYVVGHKTLIANLPTHFKNNFVCNSNQIVNLNAIGYLRDYAVPPFTDLVGELDLESIEHALEELSWREKFGRDPLDAYNSILSHIKQLFGSSVITVRSPQSVPITSASGPKVSDQCQLKKVPKSSTNAPKTYSTASARAPLDTSTTTTTTSSAASSVSKPINDAKNGEENQEEVIVVDCDLAASVELLENNDETDTNDEPGYATDDQRLYMAAKQTKRKRRASKDADKNNGSSKAKKANVDSTAQGSFSGRDQIKVLHWMPPMGVQLEPYYYATKEGHVTPAVAAPERSSGIAPDTTEEPSTSSAVRTTTTTNDEATAAKYKFKCHACKKTLEDNLKMMKHLRGHINALKQFNLDLSDLTHCKYCFREFASPYAMQTHVEEVHVAEEPAAPVCRICDKEFVDVATLCLHMKSSHVQSEMPYKCLVCKFRTSFYQDVINHFQETHGGTDTLLCIHCLQVFAIRFGPGIQEGLTYNFYRHIYKHQSKSINRRCSSCCLSFLSCLELQQHRINDHCSFAKQNGVKPVLPSSKAKAIYIDLDLSSPGSASKKERKLPCIECKMSVHTPRHFSSNMACSLCSYVTCCVEAFDQHIAVVHLNRSSLQEAKLTRFPVSSTYELSCVCNFVVSNGDMMAKHLSKCDNKWCYFTGNTDSGSMDATSKVNLHELGDDAEEMDDDEEEIEPGESATPAALNDDQHNMMNVLGLMRVNPRRRLRSKSTASS